jgi:hypothetical protein
METTTATTLLDEKLRHNPKVLSINDLTITWETNYNNKMQCNAFLHVDLKPVRMPLRSIAEQLKITISTADNSHPPVVVKLIDMMLIELHQLPISCALASHGIDTYGFADFIINKYKGQIDVHTEIAVYYYQKIL